MTSTASCTISLPEDGRPRGSSVHFSSSQSIWLDLQGLPHVRLTEHRGGLLTAAVWSHPGNSLLSSGNLEASHWLSGRVGVPAVAFSLTVLVPDSGCCYHLPSFRKGNWFAALLWEPLSPMATAGGGPSLAARALPGGLLPSPSAHQGPSCSSGVSEGSAHVWGESGQRG